MPPPASEKPSIASASRPARLAWLAAGWAFVVLGVVGLILPVMPGVVFLILAAACFSRGSPRLEKWLLEHPRLGPSIVAWRRDGAIPVRAKIAAFTGMAFSAVLVSLSGAPPIAIGSTLALVAAGALYIGTRPLRAESERDENHG